MGALQDDASWTYMAEYTEQLRSGDHPERPAQLDLG
jgi:hypothetical protein